MESKEYWNRYWSENRGRKTFFNSLVDFARRYYFAKAFAGFIARHYNIKGKSVCEIGSGSGLTLSYLKKMGAGRCLGVDFSDESMKYANEMEKDCSFVQGDAFRLDIPDKNFDLVYSLGFLEHYAKEQQILLLNEQKRIAKECVFIEVPFNIFYFRWLFAINRRLGRTTTFSDEELFDKQTFKTLGLKGKSKLMPRAFFLTIGHFEYLKDNI